PFSQNRFPLLRDRRLCSLPHSGRNAPLFLRLGRGLLLANGCERGLAVGPRLRGGLIQSMDGGCVRIRLIEPARYTVTRVAALLLLAMALAACSLFDKDAIAPDEPADKLYNEGLYFLNTKKDPKEAAKKFEEVDRQHPYSEWARKALIMSAYAYYEAGAY